MPEDIIAVIRRELLQHVDEKTKSNYQRVFKEKVTFYVGIDPTADSLQRKSHFLRGK